ncbi:molybdopterin cofactor-binding domain-containing protein [Acidobacteriota bacterium]
MNIKDDEYYWFDSGNGITHARLDRREFLKLSGGGIIVLFTAGESLAVQQRRRGSGYPDDFNAYLKVGEDGRISCFTGKIEMGQGIMTSFSQMLADELDVSLDSVDIVLGDTSLCPYDSGTFGSRSTKYFGPPLRQAAAEARAVLLLLASEKLKIPAEKLTVKNGSISVKDNSRINVSFAELTQGKKIERHLQVKPPIKHHSKHTISGLATDRLDGRPKVTGEARFAGDICLPGLLHARILRPPSHGSKLKSVDTSKAEKVEGVKIIRDGDIIAALHKHWDVADRAVSLIEAEFLPSGSKLDNSSIFEHLKSKATGGQVVVENGSLDTGKQLSQKQFQATYLNHYVAHAPSEPHTAVAHVEGEKVTVWASTQSPFRAQREVAQALELPQANVRVITPFVGCGFGGKNQGYQVTEAARLSKLSGKPVQVAWSRKEEFFYDTFRPAAVIDIKSGVNDSDKIVFWDYNNMFAGSRSSEPVYAIPHHRVLSIGNWGGGGSGQSVHPFGTGAWRGPGSNTNVFAIESHIDLMAAGVGLDPLTFRMKNLTDDRMKKVLAAAADKFGHKFQKAPSGKGYGLACTNYLGTYLATIAEVEASRTTGEIRVKRLVCAQDTGEVINPEGIHMQIEGCLTMGLGYCLTEEIQFRDGRVLDENFDTYQIPRFSWLPKIETVIVDNPELAPQGCGEPSITSMGAVIANAVFDAIGVRMFTLPMTPTRVKEMAKE